MPAYSIVATVNISAPPRGSRSQAALQYSATRMTATFSWGLQPAEAMVEWASSGNAEIVPLSSSVITVGGHTFYGLFQNVVAVNSSDGRTLMQRFVDARLFLQWDYVFGCFNKRETKMVNGKVVRRYWHILPENFNTSKKTYTDEPYTGREILEFLFESDTVESPWVRSYHSGLNVPVYDVDCLSGKPLGTAVLEVTERCGLVFTLWGGFYRLVWARKGEGSTAIPNNSDQRRVGESLSGNPTRVRVLGDRNLYQVLDIEMEKDWKTAWEQFFDVDLFFKDIFDHEKTEAASGSVASGTRYNAISGDVEGVIGRQLCNARALTMTVAEYAKLRDARQTGSGEAFRDYRKFAGRSRMQMPVVLYLKMILFRAFRPPASFQLRNADGFLLTLDSLELSDRSLVEVTHDPTTGKMDYEEEIQSAGNGYAIVKGYQVGPDAFRTIRPEHFNFEHWKKQQEVWRALPFHIDDSGEGNQFILFDAPVIKSEDLMTEITIGGVKQRYCALKASPSFVVPPVRASLVFAAEKFSYYKGTGTKDYVENVQGLNGEYVGFANLDPVIELEYADGKTASQKAVEIADTILAQQFYYLDGGYVVQGSNATPLTSLIDRVTVTLDGANGLNETVDLTTERANRTFTPERDFDRKAQLQPLLPGQRELKEQANQFRLFAAALRQDKEALQTLVDAFHQRYGGVSEKPFPVFIQNGTGTLPVGTPLWRESTGKTVLQPGASVSEPVFAGAALRENENASGPIRVVSVGVVPMRVQGPVDVNHSVGLPKGGSAPNYLSADASVKIGQALESIADSSLRLILVRLGVGSGSASEESDPVWG